MKKLLVLLVVLAMVAITSPLYAGDNVTVGGEFKFIKDTGSTAGSFAKAELNISSMVGDYNTVKLELDSEGGDWPGNVAVDDFRLETDVFGALGLDLPVTLNTTVGYFDSYFTGWKYINGNAAWDRGVWPVNGNLAGPYDIGGMQADIGVGPVTVSYNADFEFQTNWFGVSGGFGPVGAYASFSLPTAAPATGVLTIQADYSGSFGDLALYVPAHFVYDLGASWFQYGAGAAVDYTSLVHFGVGFYGTTDAAFDNLSIDLSSKPIGDLGVGVSAYMDFGGTDAFAGLDAWVNYMFGAATFQLGYGYAPEGSTVTVMGEDGAVNGLYLGVYIAY
jgi:hypothetical protein